MRRSSGYAGFHHIKGLRKRTALYKLPPGIALYVRSQFKIPTQGRLTLVYAVLHLIKPVTRHLPVDSRTDPALDSPCDISSTVIPLPTPYVHTSFMGLRLG